MLFSRKSILTTGKKPIRAATKVINASASASSAFAKCWVHSTSRTSALLRTAASRTESLRRAYSSRSGGSDSSNGGKNGGGLETSTLIAGGLPFYRAFLLVQRHLHHDIHPFIGKLVNAWTETPTKWYPLPLAVGALLLVAIQYRRKMAKAQKEVQVNEDGLEIIKLKGPWHVRI